MTEGTEDFTVHDVASKLQTVMTDHRDKVALALDYLTMMLDGQAPDKEITFVTGAPRTGGTYVTKALCDFYQIDRNQHAAILHDGFPALGTIANQPHPKAALQRVWQWAQWLALTDRIVVKKLHTLVYDMDMADFLGAIVIGTTRDMWDAYESLQERGPSDVDRQVREAVGRLGGRTSGDLRKLWPTYWSDFYGRLRATETVEFGPDMASQWGATGFVSKTR